MSAREITQRAGGEWCGSYGIAACPVCQPEKRRDQRALTIRQSAGRLYMKCHKSDCHIRDIKAALGGEFVEQRRDLEVQRIEDERRIADQERAAKRANWLLHLSRLEAHPYMRSKGFKDRAVRVLSLRDLEGAVRRPAPFCDLRPDDPVMLLRVTDTSHKTTSLQMIGPGGEKVFLRGGRVSGCGRFIPTPYSHHTPRTVICEGYATGLSIARSAYAARLSVDVWCALSAQNMIAIKKGLDADCVIADNDLTQTGIKAAKETGLPYVAPPVVGEDFNDLWKRSPDEAGQLLKDLLLRVRSER